MIGLYLSINKGPVVYKTFHNVTVDVPASLGTGLYFSEVQSIQRLVRQNVYLVLTISTACLEVQRCPDPILSARGRQILMQMRLRIYSQVPPVRALVPKQVSWVKDTLQRVMGGPSLARYHGDTSA